MPEKSTTIRVNLKTKKTIEELAASTGNSQVEIVAEAVEKYRRRRLLQEINESFARLRENPEEWEDYQREVREWDSTLMDGLEEEDFSDYF
ncbi:MAG: ribbon-helix-helix protein, CopG family [Actinobacteria bacterium]|nr:ribbon-helix-helix protein, CopG family [Actinomycetota bacterium]MBU1943177.1 ribbon-helix-helix protein, CopG family [Actinomycetota bacterium]MBU2687855.1 ribbon-helix-helix protein, CopG family [Actinomycetota bacterium]